MASLKITELNHNIMPNDDKDHCVNYSDDEDYAIQMEKRIMMEDFAGVTSQERGANKGGGIHRKVNQGNYSTTEIEDSTAILKADDTNVMFIQNAAANRQGNILCMPKRFVLVCLACIGIAISYADRTNIAIAIIPMSQEFGWSPVTEGIVFSSFYYGYIATQILGGYLSDRFGGKWVMTVAALGWSIFTILAPIAVRINFPLLIVCRVMLGLSEGLAYPSINSTLSAWLPKSERSRATGAVNSFSFAGAAIALVLSSPICASSNFGWPYVFYLFGSMGLVWVLPWITLTNSYPDETMPPDTLMLVVPPKYVSLSQEDDESKSIKSDNSEEGLSNIDPSAMIKESPNIETDLQKTIPKDSEFIIVHEEQVQVEEELDDQMNYKPKKRSVPWLKILSNKYTWAILINQYCNCWGFFVLLQWVPSFYSQEFGVDLKSLGLASITPYIVQACMGLIAGFVADWLVNKRGVPLVYIRKGSQSIALLGAAFFLLMAGFVAKNIVQGIIFITCALGLNALSTVGMSVAHFDINTEFAGIIFGMGNTAATLTGIIGVQATGFILARTHNWSLVFLLAAFHYVLGTIVWLILAHPDRKLILSEDYDTNKENESKTDCVPTKDIFPQEKEITEDKKTICDNDEKQLIG